MHESLINGRTATPRPTPVWNGLSGDKKKEQLEAILVAHQEFKESIQIVACKSDGQVIVRLLTLLAADKRGTLLLDFEELLKKYVDTGLVVWVEALGDKSSLRNLRGIEVKNE
jgi:hypothetical protein